MATSTLADTFNRANADVLGVASDGGTWSIDQMLLGSGTPATAGIRNNAAVVLTGAGTWSGAAVTDTGTRNADFTIDYSTTGYSRAIFWYAYNPLRRTGYYLDFDGSIHRFIDGASGDTQIGQPVTLNSQAPFSNRHIRIQYDDATSTHTISVNGVASTPVVDHSPPGAPYTGTYVGFWAHQATTSTGETFDNFVSNIGLSQPINDTVGYSWNTYYDKYNPASPVHFAADIYPGSFPPALFTLYSDGVAITNGSWVDVANSYSIALDYTYGAGSAGQSHVITLDVTTTDGHVHHLGSWTVAFETWSIGTVSVSPTAGSTSTTYTVQADVNFAPASAQARFLVDWGVAGQHSGNIATSSTGINTTSTEVSPVHKTIGYVVTTPGTYLVRVYLQSIDGQTTLASQDVGVITVTSNDLRLFRADGLPTTALDAAAMPNGAPARLMPGGGSIDYMGIGITDQDSSLLRTWSNVRIRFDPATPADSTYTSQAFLRMHDGDPWLSEINLPTWQGFTEYFSTAMWIRPDCPLGAFAFDLVLTADGAVESRHRVTGTVVAGEVERSWDMYGGSTNVFHRPPTGTHALGETITLLAPRGVGDTAADHGAILRAQTNNGPVPLDITSWTPVEATANAYTGARTLSADYMTVDPAHVAVTFVMPGFGGSATVELVLDNGSISAWTIGDSPAAPLPPRFAIDGADVSPMAGRLGITNFSTYTRVSWSAGAAQDGILYVHWDDVSGAVSTTSPGTPITAYAGEGGRGVVVNFVVAPPDPASTYDVWVEIRSADDSAQYAQADMGQITVTSLVPAIPGYGGVGVRVAVYAPDTVSFIAFVPRRRNVRWLDEVNTAGTGQFDVHLDDQLLADHPTLLNDNNVVRFYVGEQCVKAWRIEDVSPVRVGQGEKADRWVTVQGRGPMSDLEVGVVYPEYGIRPGVGEDRYFNFASIDGVWRNPSEWVAPQGIAWRNMTGPRQGNPKGWPDPNAQWLWVSDPTAVSNAGVNWFRASINVTESTNAYIYATADNRLTLYIDGVEVIAPDDIWSWKRIFTWQLGLAPGEHTLAAEVTNDGYPGQTFSPAGFICTIVRADANGDPTGDFMWRSTTANVIVKGYGSTPGWTGAAVVQQLVVEAQKRGVTNLLPVSFSFSGAYDSSGAAWTDVQARSTKIGTTDLADMTQQVIEVGMDVEVDVNWVMHAWKRRGINKSGSVIIRPNRDITAATGTRKSARVRNQALLKYDGGWMEMFAPASKDTYGRREVGLSVGTATDASQTQLVGETSLREVVQPEQTIPVSYTSAKGPQPYVDFRLGDTILVPDVYTGMTPGRLMSIAGSEFAEGSGIQWDLDFYPDTNDDAISTTATAGGVSYNDPAQLYYDEVISDSPWGYWRLQENDPEGDTWLDVSGHKYTLTMHWPGKAATPQTTTHKPQLALPGPVDKAVQFDLNTGGSGVAPFTMAMAKTDVSNANLYKSQAVTFECWLKRVTTPAQRSMVMALYVNGTATMSSNLGINSAGVAYFQYLDTNANMHILLATEPLSTGRFTHVAGSYGPRGARLYIDGKLHKSAPVAGILTHVGYQFALRGDVQGDPNDAIIAEPAVYFQQLDDSRLASHFTAAAYTP